MKIGIYVGSFNPVHLGHIKIVNYLLEKNYLDRIYVVPTKNYWDKNDLIDLKYRIDMLKYIEKANVFIDEVNNNLSYTYQVLYEYSKLYSKDDIYLIIGADNIINFDKWKNIDEILTYKVIVLNRNNIDIEKYIKEFGYDLKRFVVLDDYPYLNISASEIREDIEENKIHLDEKVYNYIKTNNLY